MRDKLQSFIWNCLLNRSFCRQYLFFPEGRKKKDSCFSQLQQEPESQLTEHMEKLTVTSMVLSNIPHAHVSYSPQSPSRAQFILDWVDVSSPERRRLIELYLLLQVSRAAETHLLAFGTPAVGVSNQKRSATVFQAAANFCPLSSLYPQILCIKYPLLIITWSNNLLSSFKLLPGISVSLLNNFSTSCHRKSQYFNALANIVGDV